MMSDVAASCICVRVVSSAGREVHLPPCIRNNEHTNAWCCHITHHNEIFITLISDFSQEIYVLPDDDDDDMRCAIETCRSSESVLV
jgi:hypothetical protein